MLHKDSLLMLCPPSFLEQNILSLFHIFQPDPVSALSRHLCQGSQVHFKLATQRVLPEYALATTPPPKNKPLARTRVDVILLLTLAEKKRNAMSSFSSSGCFFSWRTISSTIILFTMDYVNKPSTWPVSQSMQHGQIVQSSVLLPF